MDSLLAYCTQQRSLFPSHFAFDSFEVKHNSRRRRLTASSRKRCGKLVRSGTRFGVISWLEARRSSKFDQEAEESAFLVRPEWKSRAHLGVMSFSVSCRSSESSREVVESSVSARPKKNVFQCIARHIVFALFCVAIGCSPVCTFQVPAIAAVATKEVNWTGKKEGEEKKLKWRSHQYSGATQRLLESVSGLLKTIEQLRKGNVGMGDVEASLKILKLKKDELQDEILNEYQVVERELMKKKDSLLSKSDKIIDKATKQHSLYKNLMEKPGKERIEKIEKIERLGASIRGLDEEYSKIWDQISKIEDEIQRREAMALSVGVRELCFIERECEELVERMRREMKHKSINSPPESSSVYLSKPDIQKELETAQIKHMLQKILPGILDIEDNGSLFNQDSMDFALRIEQGLEDSRKMQTDLETCIRINMKKFGDEKRFVVNTPEDEVLKGFPEVELKWMFGDKEVVVPKAIGIHLHHGWKKWREEAKADLKRNLLQNADFGKQYMVQQQERILLDRDRVVSKTWFNEARSRWEMDPIGVPYAVSSKIVQQARIRHDWGAMYIALKGDDKEYYVDIKEFEMLFEDLGGFDGLYTKMLACGIPTAVQLMWIPFSELDIRQQFLLTMRFSYICLKGLWKTNVVSYARDWLPEKVRDLTEDSMFLTVIPILDLLPHQAKIGLGLAWPDELDRTVGSTWYLRWRPEAEVRFKSRVQKGIKWLLLTLGKSLIYGFVLFLAFQFLTRQIQSRRIRGYWGTYTDQNLKKLHRVKVYYKLKNRLKLAKKRAKKAKFDPVTTAFDAMKRVKNPPIRLEDFASIDSMKEEINEVVAFLQNPRAFQEMGARAPRGVLIVGERSTGKTSLALAIAAEAKVPVVRISAKQLEAGLWVGQSASNVRELFITARNMAPVIIFVEDFDDFAGVRGKYIHTENQDHEAFINQLLVELDGFENQEGVVLMATTRHLNRIDAALRRPGRMDRVFHLQTPTQPEREKILRLAAKETMDDELIDYVDWRKVAEKTEVMLPMDLKHVPLSLEGSAFRSKFLDADELMSYCSWFATFSNVVPKWVQKTKVVKKMCKVLVNYLGLRLTKEDMQKVVDLMEPYGQLSNGIELQNPPLDWTRDTKFPHAVWAAGRGLIALLLPNFDVVDNLWLESTAWQGIGCTKITKARKEGSVIENSESRSYLEKKLVFCFGSYVAAQLLLPLGDQNFLSLAELNEAQKIATRMVIQYGWGPDDSPVIYHHMNTAKSLSMGSNHKAEIATKVEKMFDLGYSRTKEILQKNQRVLEKVVEELLVSEFLTAKDLERIVEESGGVQEMEPFSLQKSDDEETVPLSFLDDGNASETALLGVTM